MAQLGSFKFRRGDREYELTLDWDDEAFAAGTISFGIEAKGYPIDNPNRVEPIQASVRVEGNADTPATLVVNVQGEDVARIPLADLSDEAGIIDSIPAHFLGPDPVTGCLVRAGISACIGQIITCKNETGEAPWFRHRMHAIAQCLRSASLSICGTAVYRAALCIARAGF